MNRPSQKVIEQLCETLDWSLLGYIPNGVSDTDGYIPVAVVEHDGNTQILFIIDRQFVIQPGLVAPDNSPIRHFVEITARIAHFESKVES